MLKADVVNEAACYSNHATQKWIQLSILHSAYTIFKSTSRIEKIDSLSTLNFVDGSIQQIHNTMATLDSAVIDATKIILCFENFFKAELLSYGYIVHEIDSRVDNNKYKDLLKTQKIKPLKISEVKDREGLKYIRGCNYIFNSLKNKTLKFRNMTSNDNYKKTFRLESRLFDILSEINKQRNNLHLMIHDSYHYNDRVISNYKYLINIVNNRIVVKHNRLYDQFVPNPREKICEINYKGD